MQQRNRGAFSWTFNIVEQGDEAPVRDIFGDEEGREGSAKPLGIVWKGQFEVREMAM